MVIVDTSAWIDFFKDVSPFADKVEQLVESGQACFCGPILTELLRGCSNFKQRDKLRELILSLAKLEDPVNLWEDAGLIGAGLSKKGYNLKTLDLLIATYALSYGVPILTKDKDFKLMKKAGLDVDLY